MCTTTNGVTTPDGEVTPYIRRMEAAIVSQSHSIDALASEVGQFRRQTADALALLEVMPHALANGRTEVLAEYIDRVQQHLVAARVRVAEGVTS